LAAGLVLVWLSVWFLFGCRPGSCSAVHETADPEVIVAEFDYVGHVATTDTTFRVANIQVLRIRDGLIVESRDYHDHLAFAHALGHLPQLAATMTSRNLSMTDDHDATAPS
jgi:hypothetical protein